MMPLLPTDPPEIAGVLWDFWKGDLAFDVGAHLGENAQHMEAAGFTRIVMLEPHEGSFAALRERFADRYDVRHVAVSDHAGTVRLADVPAAAAKGELVTAGTDGMEWSPRSWDAASYLTVPCVTLDMLAAEIGDDPDLVVVDTEGHEGLVLGGAEGILARGRAGWLVEFHSPQLALQCIEMLTSAGYLVQLVRHPHYPEGSQMWHQHGWLKAVPARSAEAVRM